MQRPKPAAIDRATALRYMGAAGWQPDAAVTALLDKAETLVMDAATPRAALRLLPRSALPTEGQGNDLRHHLEGCSHLLLMAATLGGELDKYPEAAFSNVGNVDEVIAKAKKMGAV